MRKWRLDGLVRHERPTNRRDFRSAAGARDGVLEALFGTNCMCSMRMKKLPLSLQRDIVPLRCIAVTVSTASGVNSLALSRLGAAAPIRSLHEAPARPVTTTSHFPPVLPCVQLACSTEPNGH